MCTVTRRRFRELELLDLFSRDVSLVFPKISSRDLVSSLKCLRVREADPQSLVPLFLVATQLVELALGGHLKWGQSQVLSLLSHLERMPCVGSR